MEKVRYMISDAASMAGVESHVLRYWEEELDLTIPRNEMGHRYYTSENIQEFKRIKELKEQGYQLKAIRAILHNGEAVDPPPVKAAPDTTAVPLQQPHKAETPHQKPLHKTQISPWLKDAVAASNAGVPQVQKEDKPVVNELSAEERMAQFRELMSDIVGRAIAQNNEALSLDIGQEVRETVLKEMNYLFREQEDAEEERFQKLDAAIRGKLKSKHSLFAKKEKDTAKKKKDKTRKVGNAVTAG